MTKACLLSVKPSISCYWPRRVSHVQIHEYNSASWPCISWSYTHTSICRDIWSKVKKARWSVCDVDIDISSWAPIRRLRYLRTWQRKPISNYVTWVIEKSGLDQDSSSSHRIWSRISRSPNSVHKISLSPSTLIRVMTICAIKVFSRVIAESSSLPSIRSSKRLQCLPVLLHWPTCIQITQTVNR